jgi:hypothetical protein
MLRNAGGDLLAPTVLSDSYLGGTGWAFVTMTRT